MFDSFQVPSYIFIRSFDEDHQSIGSDHMLLATSFALKKSTWQIHDLVYENDNNWDNGFSY